MLSIRSDAKESMNEITLADHTRVLAGFWHRGLEDCEDGKGACPRPGDRDARPDLPQFRRRRRSRPLRQPGCERSILCRWPVSGKTFRKALPGRTSRQLRERARDRVQPEALEVGTATPVIAGTKALKSRHNIKGRLTLSSKSSCDSWFSSCGWPPPQKRERALAGRPRSLNNFRLASGKNRSILSEVKILSQGVLRPAKCDPDAKCYECPDVCGGPSNHRWHVRLAGPVVLGV